MSFIDIFAAFVLIVLVLTAIAPFIARCRTTALPRDGLYRYLRNAGRR